MHSIKCFTRINERIAYIDLDTSACNVRVATAYFPHCGYPDAHVQQMYDVLTALHDEAAKQKRTTIITGDFNAQVGKHPINADEEDNANKGRRITVGPHQSSIYNVA